MWFLEQLDVLQHIPVALAIRGPLDVAALLRSLDHIIHRHSALRATFASENGRPVQMITSDLRLALPAIDLRGFSRAGQEHVLLLTVHQLVVDKRSVQILVAETAAVYQALIQGQPSSLPELVCQYADLARQEKAWLQGGAAQEQLAYWIARLDGGLPVLELPTDRPRPAVQNVRGAHLAFSLSRSLTVSLQALSHQAGVSLYTILLAAFESLLYRSDRATFTLSFRDTHCGWPDQECRDNPLGSARLADSSHRRGERPRGGRIVIWILENS